MHAGTDGKKRDPQRVRVLAYRLHGQATEYRLATDLLDVDLYPARELAALYGQRWEIESVFGELPLANNQMANATALPLDVTPKVTLR
ncbi:hypothetical protein ACFVXC_28170 [Streptomyces sp. NPDC058257]|uniref:hypothetical protein n=1 Tax=Streptomyces sp. NPDC058257 TaxID=3346409 RepID=UPI0036F00A5C